MRTTNMRERITFVSYGRGVVNGVPTSNTETKHMTVWAEVPKTPLREASNDLGIRTEKPTFIVRFLTDEDIEPTWRIKWRGSEYEIAGLDPDYQRRDITTITAKKVGS